MDVQMMRMELTKLYGWQWRAKVLKMTDNQIVAIYKKFKQEGKIK